MKEGFDKEIDSLLRRRAGAHVEARGDGGRAPQAGAHLDADELSAFAEDALPAAARASAASHLADCGECRGLAVNLMRASGVEAKLEKQAAAAATPSKSSESKGRAGWLSAIFAPRFLRYAAPALAVCLIAAVSFVALRSRQDRGLNVARQESAKSAAPATGITTYDGPAATTSATQPSANASSNANTSAVTSETNGAANRSAANNSPAAARENKEASAGGTVSASPSGAALDDAAPAPPPVASKSGEVARVENSPKEARRESGEDTKPVEKAKSARRSDTDNETVASEQPSQSQQQQQLNSVNIARGMEQSPDGSRKQQSRSAANNSSLGAGAYGGAARDERDRAATSAPAAGRKRAADEPRKAEESDRAKKDEDEVANSEDTRSAAGHRFRRKGSAWFDVNYKPSMPSTGVRRGTDAFRALVADIPEIGRVAEELKGEVTVVVRGRAYHIR